MNEPNATHKQPVAQSQSPQPPSGVPTPKTTEVVVILTAKQGVTRPQIMNVMPARDGMSSVSLCCDIRGNSRWRIGRTRWSRNHKTWRSPRPSGHRVQSSEGI
jgi:hypothetical protein